MKIYIKVGSQQIDYLDKLIDCQDAPAKLKNYPINSNWRSFATYLLDNREDCAQSSYFREDSLSYTKFQKCFENASLFHYFLHQELCTW